MAFFRFLLLSAVAAIGRLGLRGGNLHPNPEVCLSWPALALRRAAGLDLLELFAHPRRHCRSIAPIAPGLARLGSPLSGTGFWREEGKLFLADISRFSRFSQPRRKRRIFPWPLCRKRLLKKKCGAEPDRGSSEAGNGAPQSCLDCRRRRRRERRKKRERDERARGSNGHG